MQGETDETRTDVQNQSDDRTEQPSVAVEQTDVQVEPGEATPEPEVQESASAEPLVTEPAPAEDPIEIAIDPVPPTAPAVPVVPPLFAPELPKPPAPADHEEPPPAAPVVPPVDPEPAVEIPETSVKAGPIRPVISEAPAIPGTQMPGLPDASAAADDEADDEPMAFEELGENHSPEVPEIRAGTRRAARIVSIEPTGILVAFGAKTEGLISLDDFRDAEGNVTAQPGQEIEVVFERFGEPGEFAVLSYHDAAEDEAWRKVETAHEARVPVQAKVEERVKGGLRVDIGVSAFLPGSQVDVRPIHDLESLIGQTIEVLVVKVNRRRANVVVSRREMLEAEVKALKQETMAKLKEGEPATGRVKNITSYGVFVDLGGIDGLIHLTDISYGRVKDPSAILKPGTEVTARVLRFDVEKERVSLSIKHMEPDPWDAIEERFALGDRVKGRVASVTDYGAFLELEPGVEGLIHITEMTWSRRLRHPSKVVTVGEDVESVVLKVSREDRRISLSLKQLNPDPWKALGEEFQVGKIVEGRIRNVTTYGAFVEIAEGIDGLVHVSDLTWDTRVKNPKDAIRKGQDVKTVILHVDEKNRRLSLGIKQLEPDAWDTFLSQHATGDTVTGQVTRIAKFGAFVEVGMGVEGLCHNSQIPRGGKKGSATLQVGRRYKFEILRINEIDRKIGLRCEDSEPLAEPKAAKPKREKTKVKAPKAEAVAAQASTSESEQPVVQETAPAESAEADITIEDPPAEAETVDSAPAEESPAEESLAEELPTEPAVAEPVQEQAEQSSEPEATPVEVSEDAPAESATAAPEPTDSDAPATADTDETEASKEE